MAYGLGMDTGGTYTDAVVMDLDKGEVVCKAKSRTTHRDLSVGIRGAIDALDQSLLPEVGIVALSSTLATNSVVEGHGCKVALICAGNDYSMAVRPDHYIEVPGGHGVHGEIAHSLGIEEAEAFMRSVKGKVEGLAISSFMSVRNPEHEVALRDLARSILDVPVVCGHELSSDLGFNERTTTCVMNARLIPVMDELIRSVRSVLDEKGIRAPLMISRGNGSMMKDDFARERPVETIMSGPAASLMGAMSMTGVRDAVVVDIGGTTTDIGVLRDGRPSLDPQGIVVGGKRTRVLAARIFTSGIGGDSRIVVNPGRAVLTPRRVIPLCVAAQRWPSVAERLRKAAGNPPRPMHKELKRPEKQLLETEMVMTVRMPRGDYGINDDNMRLLELAYDEPVTLADAAERLGVDTLNLFPDSLSELGLLTRVGFTPTDVLHAEGIYTEFDEEASRNGVAYLSALAGMTPEEFIADARKAIRTKLCTEVMNAVISEDSGTPVLGPTGEDLFMKAVTGTPGKDFSCLFRLDKPIIGIGAPSGVYTRWIGEVLGTEVLVEEDSDVGNAVGAICSSVSESVKFQISPVKPVEGTAYEVFSRFGKEVYTSMDQAIEACTEKGREYVTRLALENNAESVEVTVDLDRQSYSPGSGSWGLEDAVLVVTAAGKPRMF